MTLETLNKAKKIETELSKICNSIYHLEEGKEYRNKVYGLLQNISCYPSNYDFLGDYLNEAHRKCYEIYAEALKNILEAKERELSRL